MQSCGLLLLVVQDSGQSVKLSSFIAPPYMSLLPHKQNRANLDSFAKVAIHAAL